MGFIFNTNSITPHSESSGDGSGIIDTLTVIPTTSQQTITAPSGTDGYNPIIVNAVTSSIDNNIIAENIKKDVTILNVTGNYEGSSGGEYVLTRVLDDNGNEIGTAFMEFTDTNGNKFKVVCLDAQYRKDSSDWCSDRNAVTNMPMYDSSHSLWWYDNAKETATENTQLILDYCSAGGFTSTSCSHCRSQSFTINGVTYYGQLPNMREVFEIWKNRIKIDQMDISASRYSSTNFRSSRDLWSSTQCTGSLVWLINTTGYIVTAGKLNSNRVCPVLEIPL